MCLPVSVTSSNRYLVTCQPTLPSLIRPDTDSAGLGNRSVEFASPCEKPHILHTRGGL